MPYKRSNSFYQVFPGYYQQIYDFVLQTYNTALSSGEDVESAFNNVQEHAKLKGIKYSSVFGQMGLLLKSGEAPTIKQPWYASGILILKN